MERIDRSPRPRAQQPYSAVTDRHVTDYFDSCAVSPYRGLSESGIQTYHHHRTLENYLDAFHAGGLRLTKLTDVLTRADSRRLDAYLPVRRPLPRYMLLAFSKPSSRHIGHQKHG